MLDYFAHKRIAWDVIDRLNIPEDAFADITEDTLQEFLAQYSEDYIRTLVDAELEKYDISDNTPEEIEDIRENAVEDVMMEITRFEDQYREYQHSLVTHAYDSIVEQLQEAFESGLLSNVDDMDVLFEPVDWDIGAFREERSITFTISNGATITFDIDIDD